MRHLATSPTSTQRAIRVTARHWLGFGALVLCLASCSKIVHAGPSAREASRDRSTNERGTVDRGTVERGTIIAIGVIEALESPLSVATARASSYPRVAELRVRSGEHVRAGQTLAVLAGAADAKLRIAIARRRLEHAELAIARRALVHVTEDVNASESKRLELDSLRAVAEERRSELRRAELEAADTLVVAPVDGTVDVIHARPGEAVRPERGLLELTTDARVIRGRIPWSASCARLAAGAAARFTGAGHELAGTIREVRRRGLHCELVATIPGNELREHLGASGVWRVSRP